MRMIISNQRLTTHSGMSINNKIELISNLFEDYEIRCLWDLNKEDYWISIVDVVNALAKQKDARKYWSSLKARLKKWQWSDYKL